MDRLSKFTGISRPFLNNLLVKQDRVPSTRTVKALVQAGVLRAEEDKALIEGLMAIAPDRG
jgi:hypothetical protein